MDNLTYELRALCRRNRDGSHGTQADRTTILTLVSRQLLEAGFRRMHATSLKRKHVEALLERWLAEGLSPGTIKNRMAALRWWAQKVGNPGAIPADNVALGIPDRRFVTNDNKAQQAFGLRRKESLLFRPHYADRGDHIVLKGSWTKGGRPRTVLIRNSEQRTVLDSAHRLVGAGSFIPADKTFIQQRNTYDGQCNTAGLSKMHGLRHLYAQVRYEELTGWKAPAAGGPVARMLTAAQRTQDAIARQTISRELGHERPSITVVYLGR